MTAEEETLEKIKFVISCNNDAQAIRLIEQYGYYKKIEFAKFHVQEALVQASVQAITKPYYTPKSGYTKTENFIELDSILNAYPLENIK